MSIINQRLTTSTVTTVYASTGNSAVTTMYLCNTSGQTVQANVHVLTAGASANVANQIYCNLPIAGYDTYVMDSERLLFNDSDSLAVKSSISTGNLSVTLSYTGI